MYIIIYILMYMCVGCNIVQESKQARPDCTSQKHTCNSLMKAVGSTPPPLLPLTPGSFFP